MTYHMFYIFRAGADVVLGECRKGRVPLEILGAMNAAPVPVSVKHSTNELLVIDGGNVAAVAGVASD